MQVRVFNAVPVASPARPDVNPSSKAAEPYPLPSKHPSAFEISRSRYHDRKAIALVVVLFAVALVSIVVLAYFNLAILNRKTSFSSAGQARANLVALSALDYIKGDFISEIAAGSTQELDPTGVGVPIYVPSTNSTMLPYRMTANIPADYTIPPNLVKWSSGTYPLWPPTAAYGSSAGPTRGSSGNSTTNASINGHFLAPTLWTKPVFGTNTTLSPSVVPQWVYLTRQGPISATTANLPTMSDPTQSGYVIGRYAYIVYDEGGLLDIAAAGYSPTTFSSDPTDVGRKGSQGFADLTQLGLTTAQVDQLVGWRNAGTWNSTNAYLGYLTTNAPTSGFLTAATNTADQAFVSRQDLIQYWFNEMGLTTAAGTNSLMYLTTFSREKNAPSWGPEHDANDTTSPTYWNGTNLTIDPINNTPSSPPPAGYAQISYAYRDNANTATNSTTGQAVYNRFLPDVRVTTSFTRLSNETAQLGEPLIKNKFDLSKLSWITYNNTPPTGVGATDIYHYFGLTQNPDGSGSWIYNHNTVAPPGSISQAKRIMTLDQVAATGREPDFFEILQTTILQGSMGLISGDPTHASDNSNTGGGGGEYYRLWMGPLASFPFEAPLARADTDWSSNQMSAVYAQEKYHVIQIGANIIDQYTTDNFPTDIMLNGEHFYGVKNLPYISALGETVLRPAPGKVTSLPGGTAPDATFNDPNQQYVQQWMTFALWNPHQNAAYPPSVGPAKIRIAVTGGEEYPQIHNLQGYSTFGFYAGRVFEPQMTGGVVTPIITRAGSSTTPTNKDGPAWIGLNLSDYANHFSEPTMIDPNLSFTSDTPNPTSSNMNDGYGRIISSLGWQRAGIYLGYSKSPDNPYKVPLCAGIASSPNWANYATTHTPPVPQILYDAAQLATVNPFTIELQYEDPSNQGPSHWHTYQVFRGVWIATGSGTGDAYMEPNDPAWAEWNSAVPPNNSGSVANGYSNPSLTNVTGLVGVNSGPLAANQEYGVNTLIDPRTARLNIQNIHLPTTAASVLTNTIGSSTQVLPGADVGAPPYGHFPKAGVSKSSRDLPNTWNNNLGTDPSFYLDRDFIRRVGDSAGWAGASPFTTGAATQRPYMLSRPFRSVAELGYTFRDDAWKTLNMISANSGDGALLDAFYIGSTNSATPTAPPPDVIAGKMNINSAAASSASAHSTASPPLQALLSQGLRDYQLTAPTTINNSVAVADAGTLSANIISFEGTNGPLANVADLPSVFPQDTSLSTANPGLKGQREALVRALADSSDTRTWMLMIDIVAQAGKFNPKAGNLSNFTVEGEKHYWLHVAIDRFTGEVVGEQLEPVWE